MRRIDRQHRAKISLTLNGRAVSAHAEPRTLLSDFLRHSLGATGTRCRLRAWRLRLLHRHDR